MVGKIKNGFIIFILVIANIPVGKPLRASVDIDELKNAITSSKQVLISQQEEEGYWFSYVETNTLYNAIQILLYYYLNKEDEEKETIEGLCRYLVNTQSEDGSWPFYDGGPADLGLTTLNYFALKLSGYQKEDLTLVLARDYIRSHGGAESIHGIYKTILALFDQFHFSVVPDIPLLPLFYIAPRLSWLRIMFIPLMVVLHERAFFHPPQVAYITELFIADGLFYDYLPNTLFPLLSLKALEHIVNNEEAINKAIQGLHSFQQHLPEGIHQPPTDGTIPATFSSIMALSLTNVSPENPVIKKAVEFLWSRQNRRYGDWVYQMMIPVRPGGWGFSLNSESFPDTDDTATTLFVLRTIYGERWEERRNDFRRGVRWLLAMQNWDGGWGTWDREAGFLTTIMKEALPTVVLNESVVDHTTRVLMTLSLFGYTEARSLRVARAVRWIKAQQLEDGSWPGTWFVNYIYQTANVLGVLSQVKAAMSGDFIQKSLDYILEKQREDGGWGESPNSFSAGHYVPLGYSSPSQTALILFGMLQFLRGNKYHYIDQLREPINRAIHFILSTQGEDGLWQDPTYVGTVFPQIQYVRYPIFQEASILGILGMYYQDLRYF